MPVFRPSKHLSRQKTRPEPPSHHFSILIQGMNYAPEMIGVGKYTTELATWLAARGHAVEVVTAHPHYPGFVAREPGSGACRRTREGGVWITRCPLVLRNGGRGVWRLVAPLSFAVAAAPALIRRAVRTRPDIVLCIEPTLFAAPAAILAGWLSGAKLALHVQDLEVDAAFATGRLRNETLRRVAKWLETRLLRRFDAVVTVSNAMAARLVAKGIAVDRVDVLRNWVDIGEETTARSYRTLLGIGEEEPVVLYAGHLGAKQGVPVFLESLRRLSRRQRIHIVIAGDGPMRPLVQAACATLPNLHLLPLQPTERMAELLAMADVHVLPQDSRAADLVFPSKLGPMLASGRPTVVTANPGTELASWLQGAASVVAADDPEALAEAIGRALAGEATSQAERGRRLAQSLGARSVLPAFEARLANLLPQPAIAGVPASRPRWRFGLS